MVTSFKPKQAGLGRLLDGEELIFGRGKDWDTVLNTLLKAGVLLESLINFARLGRKINQRLEPHNQAP